MLVAVACKMEKIRKFRTLKILSIRIIYYYNQYIFHFQILQK